MWDLWQTYAEFSHVCLTYTSGAGLLQPCSVNSSAYPLPVASIPVIISPAKVSKPPKCHHLLLPWTLQLLQPSCLSLTVHDGVLRSSCSTGSRDCTICKIWGWSWHWYSAEAFRASHTAAANHTDSHQRSVNDFTESFSE